MYIKHDGFSGYNSAGEQIRQRGVFLLLVQPDGDTSAPIKAVVRKVALRQCGHWMMGRVRLFEHYLTVSGAYGSDGLPCSVPRAVYDRLSVVLPAPLVDAWNKGEGWNSAGREASAMREWAIANLEVLRK